MDEKIVVSEQIKHIKQEQDAFEAMSCSELSAYLDRHWETLRNGRRAYLTSLMVHKECREGIPYLLHQVQSQDPFSRCQALYGLEELKCREYRQLFIDLHLNDPDDKVRERALVGLCILFRGERDKEILRLALDAFDNPVSDIAMRLAAGAAMVYQLGVPKELGELPWWDEEEEDLQHPALVWAVAETRRLLASETSEDLPHQ